MDFADDPGVKSLIAQVRELLGRHLSAEMRSQMHHSGTIHDQHFHEVIAAEGWLSAAMAGSDGALGPFELLALFRELERADAPYHGLATTMIVAGIIQQAGTASMKSTVLPEILRGEAIVALGYSEPDHGSDVAAASTRADRVDPDTWRINGQKMWTSLAHVARYVLLLTRTNSQVPKHRGLTMFLVPLDKSGISIQAVHTMSSERTNVTFYDDVVVEDAWRLGDVDGGWKVMAIALGLERGVMGGTAMAEPLWEATQQWAKGERAADGVVLDDPEVRAILVRARIDIEVSYLLTQRTAWVAAGGGVPAIEGSVAKLFASERYQRFAHEIQRVAGPRGLLADGSHQAIARGELERAARHAAVTTIQGGTSEIQRNNIAERHLGLPSTRAR